jgi:hypothetical protein
VNSMQLLLSVAVPGGVLIAVVLVLGVVVVSIQREDRASELPSSPCGGADSRVRRLTGLSVRRLDTCPPPDEVIRVVSPADTEGRVAYRTEGMKWDS